MADITLIFDQFGNPNQPYLAHWYALLKSTDKLHVSGLASSLGTIAETDVKLFKPRNRWNIIKRGLNILFDKEVPSMKKIIYYDLSKIETRVIHIVKSQMYNALSSYLPNSSRLFFSFRGYETLVLPQMDSKWKDELLEIYDKAERLHFVSDYIKNKAIELGAPPEKCYTVYRTVDTDFFTASKRESTLSKIKVLSVGRLTWEKGYTDALEAIFLLKKSGIDVEYSIVGQGSDLPLLQYHIKRLALESHVKIIPYLNRMQLKQQYQNANVFLISSLSDAMPNVVLEAASMGLPIVATDVGGIPELVSDGHNGLLSEPAKPLTLFNSLKFIYENMEQSFNMGQCARSLVDAKFSSRAAIDKWVSFYKYLK